MTYSSDEKDEQRSMVRRKIDLDWMDLKVVYLLGRGYTVQQMSQVMGVSVKRIHSRIYRLYSLTGTGSHCQLVYWMLSEYKFGYPKRGFRSAMDETQLELIQMLADGYYREDIRKRLGLIPSKYDRTLLSARRKARAKTKEHLVAICWTEDWIV